MAGTNHQRKNRRMYSFTLHEQQDRDLMDFIERFGTTTAVKMAMRAYLSLEKGESVELKQEFTPQQLEQIAEMLQAKNLLGKGVEEQSCTKEDSIPERKIPRIEIPEAAMKDIPVDDELAKKAEAIMKKRGGKAGALKLK